MTLMLADGKATVWQELDITLLVQETAANHSGNPGRGYGLHSVKALDNI
jgi:hypothetical protein